MSGAQRLVSFTLAACASSKAVVQMRPFDFLVSAVLLAALPMQAQSVDGVWKSRGYGDIFEIQGTTVKTYEVTATTCVAGFTAQRDSVAAAGREATFTHGRGQVFFCSHGR